MYLFVDRDIPHLQKIKMILSKFPLVPMNKGITIEISLACCYNINVRR